MSVTQPLQLGSYFRRLAMQSERELDDSALLSAFVDQGDRFAFEAIIRRHGSMVFGVCKRVLQHQQDAEDAFQAAFLVLFMKAGSVHPRSTLPCWLYGVAYRTALKAKSTARRRQQKENQVSRPFSTQEPVDAISGELEAILDRELQALPEKYRQAIVLCDLEGKSRRDAARCLKCKEGTLSGHLTRGRRLLAERMERYGLHCSATTLGLVLTQKAASETMPQTLLNQTIEITRQLAPNTLFASAPISETVANLTQGVLKSMLLTQLRNLGTMIFVAITAMAIGLTSFSGHAAPVTTETKNTSEEAKNALKEWKIQNNYLVQDHKVLRELKCSLEQREKIEDIYDGMNEKMEEMSEKLQQQAANNPNNPNVFDDYSKAVTKEMEKAFTQVQEKVLKPEQVRRLKQIDLQSRGASAFQESSIEKALKLTDKQKADIKQKFDEALKAQQRGAVGGVVIGGGAPGGGGFGGVQIAANGAFPTRREMEKKEEEFLKSMVEMLTKDQKPIWDELVGKPFKIRRDSFGGAAFTTVGGFALPVGQAVPAIIPAVPLPVKD